MYQYCFDFVSKNLNDEHYDIHHIIQVNMNKASDKDFIMEQFNKYPNLKRVELSAIGEQWWFKIIEPQHFISVLDSYFSMSSNWLENGF